LVIRWYDEVTSTNDIARQWALEGAADGSTLCTEQQSAGRGRRGAAWISPPGQALAFSQILRPVMPRALWSRLALIAGLAVAKCLEQCGLYAEVKWPNDVLVAGKKIAGILVESMGDFVIIGVGLNVNVAEFPHEIEHTATSMLRETGREWEREELLEDLIHSMHAHAMQAEHDFSDLLRQLRERCALTDKRVSLWIDHEPHETVVRGFSESGELLIDRDGRIVALLQADQIRVIG
jgi:BirA family transcriptional regulator, biotin operon repressor / biotin---[acetyl-CoA-carboxylase] ligase